MPAFGFLLIIIGVFVLINTINGNLVNLALGKTALNFGPSSGTSTNNTPTVSGVKNA